MNTLRIYDRFMLLVAIVFLCSLVTACETTRSDQAAPASTTPLPPAPAPPAVTSRFPPDVISAAYASTTKPVKSGAPNASATNNTSSTTSANTLSASGSATQNPGQLVLSAGIDLYNNGQYQQAIKKLQAIADNSIEDYLIQTSAYKYISFSLCVLGRKAACRENFEKLLRLNPSFELTQSEAGHPTWGPVFKQAKASARR